MPTHPTGFTFKAVAAAPRRGNLKKGKNFFYRINPNEVLAEIVFVEDREKWFLQFFNDLRNDDADSAITPMAAEIIREAKLFREKRSKAGKASAEQRANKDQQQPTYVEHMCSNVQPVAVAVTETYKTLSASDNAEQEFFLTKKKKRLSGKRLETFNQFWDAFAYKKGKAEAADAWLEIPSMTMATVEEIVTAAKMEAENRHKLEAAGKTPKMAQGWLSGRRWEDEREPEAWRQNY